MLVCFDWQGVTNKVADKEGFISLFQELRDNGHDIAVMTTNELKSDEKNYLSGLNSDLQFIEEMPKKMKETYTMFLEFKYGLSPEKIKQDMVLVDDLPTNVDMAAKYCRGAILHESVESTRQALLALQAL